MRKLSAERPAVPSTTTPDADLAEDASHLIWRDRKVMNYTFNDRAKTWIPVEEIDSQTMVQIQRMSALPFIFQHLAIMPGLPPRFRRDRRHLHPPAKTPSCQPRSAPT